MLYRLAFRSFKRQVRSYLIYFLSMILAVTIFYCFSALTYNQPIVMRANQDIPIGQILNFGQGAVLAILLFFMLSANRFFLTKRAEEIGIYQLFGLKKRKITFLFFGETMVLGLFSLIAGILIGIVFSKLFSMILVKAMALNVSSDFFISWSSIFLTSGVMFFVLTIVSLRTSWLIYFSDLRSLFKENELDSQKIMPNTVEKCIGILAIGLLIACYFSAVHTQGVASILTLSVNGIGAYLLGMFLTFILGVAGTYLFFGWSLKWLTFLISRNEKFNQRDLNAFMLGNIRSRLVRNWRTTAVVTIITSFSILLVGLAVSIFSVSLKVVLFTDPVSFQVAQEDYPELKETIEKNGGAITEVEQLDFKATGSYISVSLANEPQEEQTEIVNLMSLSNYSDYRKINKSLPEIRLHENEAVLLDSLQNMFQQLRNYNHHIKIPGNELTLAKVLADHLGYASLRYPGNTLIVSDKVFYETEGINYSIQALNTTVNNEDVLANAVRQDLIADWRFELAYNYYLEGQTLKGNIQQADGNTPESIERTVRLNLSSQYPTWRLARRQTGLVVYVSAFIGLISLITTGSILSLRQLAEATRDRKNYQLLLLLGIPKKKIRQLVYRENALMFFPVMILTMANSFFGFFLLSKYISNTNFWLPNAFIAILIGTYSLFYILTVVFYRRTIQI